MDITGVRETLAATLAAHAAGDVAVVDHIPDQASAPALFVWWADPWVEPDRTLCGEYAARLDVLAVAGRFDPGGTLVVIEQMMSDLLVAVDATADYTIEAISGPGPTELGGVTYLAAVATVTTLIGV